MKSNLCDENEIQARLDPCSCTAHWPPAQLFVPAYDATRALSLRGRRLLDHLR